MAKEHEKIPKVKNAPRKTRSQSAVETLFAPLWGLGLVAGGRKSSLISEGSWGRGRGREFCAQTVLRARPFPQHKAQLICRVREKARVANWILIISRSLAGPAGLLLSLSGLPANTRGSKSSLAGTRAWLQMNSLPNLIFEDVCSVWCLSKSCQSHHVKRAVDWVLIKETLFVIVSSRRYRGRGKASGKAIFWSSDPPPSLLSSHSELPGKDWARKPWGAGWEGLLGTSLAWSRASTGTSNPPTLEFWRF